MRALYPVCQATELAASYRDTTQHAVLDDIDDINTHVGFWAPQPDFRIPERLSPGFTSFPTWSSKPCMRTKSRPSSAIRRGSPQRAIMQRPGADLVMMYIEQPDGAGHQSTLTDPRQAPTSQPEQHRRRPRRRQGRALRRVSRVRVPASQQGGDGDHGDGGAVSHRLHRLRPRHGAVPYCCQSDEPAASCRCRPKQDRYAHHRPSGQHLRQSAGPRGGRHSDAGRVSDTGATDCRRRADRADPNATFNYSLTARPHLHQRRDPAVVVPGRGRLLHQRRDRPGFRRRLRHHSRGLQLRRHPGCGPVGRSGLQQATSVFNVPNFDGAHGHDSTLPSMSAIFLATGPASSRARPFPWSTTSMWHRRSCTSSASNRPRPWTVGS